MSSGGDKMDESTKSASRSSTFTTQEKEDWKLENSSLWWVSLDFFQNPGTVLLISSIPLSLGAYYGFVQPGENLEKWVGDAPTNVEVQSPKSNRMVQRALEKEIETMAARQLGLQVASKALGVATFATLGTFSILGAVGFYLSGCSSVGEAMARTQQWASSRTQSFEDWIGLDHRESKTHPEVVATKNMTEEEEINYVYDRLMKEIESDVDTTEK